MLPDCQSYARDVTTLGIAAIREIAHCRQLSGIRTECGGQIVMVSQYFAACEHGQKYARRVITVFDQQVGQLKVAHTRYVDYFLAITQHMARRTGELLAYEHYVDIALRSMIQRFERAAGQYYALMIGV